MVDVTSQNSGTTPLDATVRNPWARSIGSLIFVSRWLQAPLYLGLIVAQLVYVVVFMIELWHLITEVVLHPGDLKESVIMLSVLGLIDVVMIANLLIMVIIGGYETFVSRINVNGHPDQPEWLSHVNANVLKVKLAMAIIGISSIHLLKTFIEVGGMSESGISHGPEKYTPTGVLWQVVIHVVFIFSALALAWIDKMSQTAARAAHHEVQRDARHEEKRARHEAEHAEH
ncbi:MAG: TIGR00645 family protein [Microbacterium sp.]|nr:TIGR00645 family protein [Microbacterium sp.]